MIPKYQIQMESFFWFSKTSCFNGDFALSFWQGHHSPSILSPQNNADLTGPSEWGALWNERQQISSKTLENLTVERQPVFSKKQQWVQKQKTTTQGIPLQICRMVSSYQSYPWFITFTFNISPSEAEWWFVATNICTTSWHLVDPLPPSARTAIKICVPLGRWAFLKPMKKWWSPSCFLGYVKPNWWLWKGNSLKLCSHRIHVRLDFRDVWRQLLHGWPQETTHFNLCRTKSLSFFHVFFLGGNITCGTTFQLGEVLTLELCLLGDLANCTFWRSNSTKSHHMRTWRWCKVTWWYSNW